MYPAPALRQTADMDVKMIIFMLHAGGRITDIAPYFKNEELTSQHVVACTFGDGGNLIDQFFFYTQFAESRRKVFNYRIDMRIVQASLDQMGMPRAHIETAVIMRPAESHGQE
jgi:hypothetical protein